MNNKTLKAIPSLPFLNISSVSDRILADSCVFSDTLDSSMDTMLLPNTVLGLPSLVGPYIDTVTKNITFKPVKKFELFTKCDADGKDICLADINQGMIGDCWFLSAIDFSINHPLYKDSIKNCVNWYDKDKQIVKVTLHQLGDCEEKTAYLDTRILINCDQIPATVSVRSNDPSELWPAMLEKGLAKLCGGYPKIEGGLMSEGMSFLHGGRGFFISSHDLVAAMLSSATFLDEFCQDLRTLYDQGYGLFTAWDEEFFTASTDLGLVNGHAYSLLDFKKVDGEWIFMIKNPWGKFEWNGKYSDADTASSLQHQVFGISPSDDGIFLMSAAELFARCEGIDIFEPKNKTLLSSL